MSTYNSKIKVSLEVVTMDETAEVYVIDSFFRVAKHGRGILSKFELKPGIYTVKIRVGFTSQETDVILTDTPEKVSFAAVEFPSAIPLFETALTHEYHIAAAVNESRKIHAKKGEGSWIFIFTRDWKSSRSENISQMTKSPHKGLKLKGKNGELIVDFENAGFIAGNQDQDAWFACNVELDPGQYRLCVEIESGKSIEQTVIACKGWQTQIFLLQKDYKPKNNSIDRRADLTNTGILMTKGDTDESHTQMSIGGFDAQNPKMKLIDLARLGLANNRQILPAHVVDMILRGKFENPMLGILGAYLLIRGKKTKIKLLKIVTENLRRILGEGTHPDLEALMLYINGKRAKYNFDLPPMLRQSWSQVVKATAINPDLIPPDSFACQNSDQILADEPWLLYVTDNQSSEESVNESVRYLLQSQSTERPDSPVLESTWDSFPLPSVSILASEAMLENTASSDEANSENVLAEQATSVLQSEQDSSSLKSASIFASDVPFETTASSNKTNNFENVLAESGINEIKRDIPITADDKTVNNLVSVMGLPKAKILQILNRLDN